MAAPATPDVGARPKVGLVLALVVAGLWSHAGCSAGPGAAPTDAAGTGDAAAPTHELHYRVAWDTAAVTLGRDVGGDAAAGDAAALFALTNDLGVRFEVHRGWLVTYSMEALACATTRADSPARPWWRRAWDAVGVQPAYAGHGDLPVSPAQLEASHVEDLATLAVADEVGAVQVARQPLCQLHVLHGRADDDAATLPTEVTLARTTLHLEGRWRPATGGAWQPFTWRTKVGWGAVLDLPVAPDIAGAGLELTVVRSLARLFDAIDPAEASELDAARQVLTNAVTHARVVVAPHLH